MVNKHAHYHRKSHHQNPNRHISANQPQAFVNHRREHASRLLQLYSDPDPRSSFDEYLELSSGGTTSGTGGGTSTTGLASPLLVHMHARGAVTDYAPATSDEDEDEDDEAFYQRPSYPANAAYKNRHSCAIRSFCILRDTSFYHLIGSLCCFAHHFVGFPSAFQLVYMFLLAGDVIWVANLVVIYFC